MIKNIKKSKKFIITSVILIICIMSLKVLDAPEYVHCGDIGICEFLEVLGLLNILNRQKSLNNKNYFLTEYNQLIHKKSTTLNIFWAKILAFFSPSIFNPFSLYRLQIVLIAVIRS